LHTNNFLKKNGEKFVYSSLTNKGALISEYYYKENFDLSKENREEYNQNIKLYNKIKTVKHEDCLLYEMALRYYEVEKNTKKNTNKNTNIRSSIIDILQQEVDFIITYSNNNHYTIKVPFKQIENFKQMEKLDGLQIADYKLLQTLPDYLPLVQSEKGIKDVAIRFKNLKTLTLADINTVNNHIISSQVKFTNCVMAWEEYFIWKHKLTMTDSTTKEKNRLPISNITTLKDYFEKDDKTRGNAFHFNLPTGKSYRTSFIAKDAKFLKEEIPNSVKEYDQLTPSLKAVVSVMISQMHNECYDYLNSYYKHDENKRDLKLKHIKAKEKYFKEVLLGLKKHN
jgi:hypothetical protein